MHREDTLGSDEATKVYNAMLSYWNKHYLSMPCPSLMVLRPIDRNPHLITLSDAAHDKNRRSAQCGCLCLFSGPLGLSLVSWHSRQAKRRCESSASAELISMSGSLCDFEHCVWLGRCLHVHTNRRALGVDAMDIVSHNAKTHNKSTPGQTELAHIYLKSIQWAYNLELFHNTTDRFPVDVNTKDSPSLPNIELMKQLLREGLPWEMFMT